MLIELYSRARLKVRVSLLRFTSLNSGSRRPRRVPAFVSGQRSNAALIDNLRANRNRERHCGYTLRRSCLGTNLSFTEHGLVTENILSGDYLICPLTPQTHVSDLFTRMNEA